MIKTIALSFLLLFIPAVSHGAATAPETNVWFLPVDAKPGDTIELNAFVYNNTKKTVTATVSFKRDSSEIGTSNVTIQPQTAKVATYKWSMPKNETIIEAEVVKAVDSAKANVPELIGVVGDVTLGTPEPGKSKTIIPVIPGKISLPSESAIKGWFGSIIGNIEPYRMKKAEYYKTLRDDTREKLGLDEATDLLDKIEDPSAPALQSDDTLTEGSLTTARHLNIGLYITYIYASAMAGLFGNVAVFYISIVLLILLILRYTIGQLL